MLPGLIILSVAMVYLGLLFGIAFYGDRRADQQRSIISNPYVYALSLAVYCTSWTFYGSVGRAARTGLDFLVIYLGPTLCAPLWWIILRKLIRICRAQRITSIAEFIAVRYGKSGLLGGLVTLIAIIGLTPYIALQLQAVSSSVGVIRGGGSEPSSALPIALFLAAFAILFGTRHLDTTERHEGLVAAVAFESLVKLLAFLAVGLWVSYRLFGGIHAVLGQAAAKPELQPLLRLDGGAEQYVAWATLTLLSMLAILCLPRQFQVAVVENVNERHLERAIWVFPLYLLAINLFVLPIALAGRLTMPSSADADMFVLTLPLDSGHSWLALLAFIGGLSAATSMVIVETIALSTMVSNTLILPVLAHFRWLELPTNPRRLILAIRRATIVGLLLLGYGYTYLTRGSYSLVSIGLISFAAVAQFAPALIGGLFWRGGTRSGVLLGLSAGFIVWAYTLPLPTLVNTGWMPAHILEQGPLGIAALRPQQLFGLASLDPISHGVFWSLLVNIGGYVGGSLIGTPTIGEQRQAVLFVEEHRQIADEHLWHGSASISDLRALLERYSGPQRAAELLQAPGDSDGPASAALIQTVERQLAGTIGAAAARVLIASVATEEQPSIDDLMAILDETSQVIAYSHQLEQQSQALAALTAELRSANAQLQELDHLKDEFIATVTHELRTPLTSIRAFSEILLDNPRLARQQQETYLQIIVKESERLTRLINQVLDLAKIESGAADWHIASLDLRMVVEESLLAVSHLFEEQGVQLTSVLAEQVPLIQADQDRLAQVMLNLLSNALKFCDQRQGQVVVRLIVEEHSLRVEVSDNGGGIQPADQQLIFEKFRQVSGQLADRPPGTGLGLPIAKQIITHLGGELWVDSELGHGSTFAFRLPLEWSQDSDDKTDSHRRRRSTNRYLARISHAAAWLRHPGGPRRPDCLGDRQLVAARPYVARFYAA